MVFWKNGKTSKIGLGTPSQTCIGFSMNSYFKSTNIALARPWSGFHGFPNDFLFKSNHNQNWSVGPLIRFALVSQ